MTRPTLRAYFALAAAGFLAVLGFLAPFAPTALAQTTGATDVGLDAVGSTVRLSATDPRIIVVRIINVALSFLAIILISIIIYAGYLWMTSGGEQEKVDRAKRLIRNAIIGVVIILSSWAITRFVLRALTEATGGSGGSSASDGAAAGGSFGFGGGLGGFRLEGIEPAGTLTIRNVEVRFLFTQEVTAAQAADHIRVLKAADNAPAGGVLTVDGRLVTFVPTAPCPAPAGDRFCLDGDTDYIARVDSAMRSATGQAIGCGGLGAVCEERFRTGNMVDTVPPETLLLQPYDGQSVPQNASVELIGGATDDVGISLLSFFGDGALVGRATPPGRTTSSSFEGRVAWSTTGIALGAHRLETVAFDADSNHATSSPVSVMVRLASCFDDQQNNDETGIDCGGSCGACTGGTCREASDCASAVCTAGRCVERPVITAISPNNGRVGTIVTISGANFGDTSGDVLFGGGVRASFPARCTETGSGWSGSEIIVEVPVGARTGAVSVKNGSSGLEDSSDDEIGPRVGPYTLNDIARPGLCAIAPERGAIGTAVRLLGAGFGSASDRVRVGDALVSAFRGWTDGDIALNVPAIPSGEVSVQVGVGEALSNPVGFSVEGSRTTEPPIIEAIEPSTGPLGQYMTIRGRNFGTQAGSVRVLSEAGAEGEADTDFPDACDLGTRYWSDNSVIFKMPATLRAPGLGASSAVAPGAYQVFLQRRDGSVPSNRLGVTVTAGEPGPGLCALLPDTGPVGTEVRFSGERFGSSMGAVRFQSGTGVAEARTILEWTDQTVRAIVPVGARTGAASLAVRSQESNALPYTVRNCNEDAGICSESERCCEGSGICVPAGGACPLVSTDAHFAWRLSTGEIPVFPEVVAECNPASRRLASPSPWDGRPGGEKACVNADLIIRFTTLIDPAQVTGENVQVRACPTAEGNCADGAVVAPALGFPRVESADTGSSLVRFRPAGTPERWAPATRYKITLTTALRTPRGIPMPENADACGEGNAYCFTFSTRPSSELCTVGSILVNPANHAFEDLDQTIDVHGNPLAAEDACLQLNPDTYDWLWTTRDEAGRSDTRVSVTDVPEPTHQDADQIATSRAETLPTDPSFVQAAINLGRTTVSGYSRMSVELTPFKVERNGPECDAACINAAIWAQFSHPLRASSAIPSNIELRRCVDAECRTMDDALPLPASAIRVMAIPGMEATAAAGRFLNINPGSLLRAGQVYRVLIRSGAAGGIVSSRGQVLASLNDPAGYVWKFRVKTDDAGRCAVDRVLLAPDEKIETAVGARQRFTAVPLSEPSACAEEGEYLISDRPYAWSVVDAAGTPDASIARTVVRTDDPETSEATDADAPIRAASSATDEQLAEIIASRDPGEGVTRLLTNVRASYEGKNGQAVYGLLCGQRTEALCPAGTGLTAGGCCAPRPSIGARYPAPAATAVCRNSLIFADFSTPISSASLESNFLLARRVTGVTCPAETQPLDRLIAGTTERWYARVWKRVAAFFDPKSAVADVWCVGAVPGSVEVIPQGTGSRVTYRVASALAPSTEYRMYVRGARSLATATADTAGIRSERGVLMAEEAAEWTFRTGTDVCLAQSIDLNDTSAASPYVYTSHPESHLWSASVAAVDTLGRVAPITPVAEYGWTWGPWISSKRDVLTVAPDAAARAGDRANVSEENKNGQAFISARFEVTEDTISTPSTTGTTFETAKSAIVDLCERPWPARTLGAFSDSEGSASLRALAPLFSSGPFYHFSTFYCLDAGATTTADDLPELRLNPVPLRPAEIDQGILRQYLFTFQDAAFRGDGIGIRIASNPLHLSAARWFAAKGFSGTPEAFTVDGYDAVRTGNTVYISGSDLGALGTSVSSTVYILSVNPDAKPATQNIFTQLLTNFALNVNLTTGTSNACLERTTVGGERIFLRDRQPVECRADWECSLVRNDLKCGSTKAKLQRDRARISDFQGFNVLLEAARARTGRYPALGTGSFIQGVSTSRWPSWGQTFASELGGAPPSDPVNRFATCGRCRAGGDGSLGHMCSDSAECASGETCVAMTGDDATRNGFDPATCWNPGTQRYLCPLYRKDGVTQYSHLYQYRSIDNGARYELSTNLEGPSTYRPALLTGLRRCSNNNELCTVNQDCNVLDPATRAVRSTGTCRATGGNWVYADFCANVEYSPAGACTAGAPLAAGQTCRLGETRSESCLIDGRIAGTKLQVCSDCREFVDGPSTVCVPDVQCGNGRIDRGETCDDGARNGQYGFCSRTCQEVQGSCGDGLVGAGERCDNGSPAGSAVAGMPGVNGAYCGAGCALAQSCSLDCRSEAPHCGDRVVDGGEYCDGNTERSAKRLCFKEPGAAPGNPCDRDSDCATDAGWVCGGTDPATAACGTETVRACSGGDTPGATCATNADCAGGRCVALSYPTFHVRTCNAPGSAGQCSFANWSACRTISDCGDGVIDAAAGEECDDGLSGNDGTGRCTPRCKLNTCGDSFMNEGAEECDFGGRNGVRPAMIEYGSVAPMCTSQCRLASVTGGYCGNGVLEAGEVCDGSSIPPDATCRSLNFDYARTVSGGREVLGCDARCEISGCQLCSARIPPTVANTISGLVRDGVLQNRPLPQARVVLQYNGASVAETFTDDTGRFSFGGIHENVACGNYEINIVLQGRRYNYATRSLDRTADPGDGYYPFRSASFSLSTYRTRVGLSQAGEQIILLMPRPARNETYVIRQWNSTVAGRAGYVGQFVDPQLVLPREMSYVGTDAARPLTRPFRRCIFGTPNCQRWINWDGHAGEMDLGLQPHAALACYEDGTDNSCASDAAVAETIMYRRDAPVARGIYRYFLVDHEVGDAATDGDIDTRAIDNVVRITWKDAEDIEHYEEVRASAIAHVRPDGECRKYWHVFDQDAVTGRVTIVNRLLCDPSPIDTGDEFNTVTEEDGTTMFVQNLLISRGTPSP